MTKKYIVVENFGEQIIIFSSGLYHADVAGSFKVISAGFMDLQYNHPDVSVHIHCYGESESLKVKARPHEDKILARILLRGD